MSSLTDYYNRLVTATGNIVNNIVTSVAGKTGAVVLNVTDVIGAAPLQSPTFGGTPNVPTAAANSNSTQAASTAFVKTAVANVVGGTGAVSSVAGKTGIVTLNKNDVDLANVDNTSDINKPISTLQQVALNNKAAGVAAVPSGGLSGQVLAKTSSTDYATQWVNTSGSVSSVAGKTGAVTLVPVDVGLGNVNNTSDTAKPVSTLQQAALDAKAPTASPAFTGTPTVPTATAGTNTTQAASTAFVTAAVAAGGGGGGGAVSSVAGKTGAVTLVNADIGTLPSDLQALTDKTTSSSTWAARGTGAFDGQRKRITGLSIAAPGGFDVVWSSALSRWVLAQPTTFGDDPNTFNGLSTQTTDQIIRQLAIPAGLMLAGRRFDIRLGMQRNNTTNTVNAQFRLGNAGTTSDSEAIPGIPINGTNYNLGALHTFGVTSTTQIQRLGGKHYKGAFPGELSDEQNNLAYNLTDLTSNIVYFSYGCNMPATGTTPSVNTLSMVLYP